jgi:hypothetical protein
MMMHTGARMVFSRLRISNIPVEPFIVGAGLMKDLIEASLRKRRGALAALAVRVARLLFSRPSLGHTGRTSCTSGMKWRSRFSMPWRSVAVELGQPEQAPRMCRNTMPSR